MTALRQWMLEDLQIRHYSPITIRIYLHAIAEFAKHFGKPPDQLSAEHIRSYQLFLVKEKKVSRPTCVRWCAHCGFSTPRPSAGRSRSSGFPFRGRVLKYLARYTHRVAISNHRLRALENGRVSFEWKDYAHRSRTKIMTLDAVEFMRRFLLHVLPAGLVRIRQFGFLANRVRKDKLALCRPLICAPLAPADAPDLTATNPDDPSPCPVREVGRLILIELLAADPIRIQDSS